MFGVAQEEFKRLSMRLRHVQTDYERARLRGDAERVQRARLQMRAITAEREQLIRHMSQSASGGAPRPAA